MKLLIIVRHAKSSWKEPSLTDFDRPLNKRGKADAPETGRRLAARGVRPDFVVSSPARRARKTAQALVRELVGLEKDEIVQESAVYEAGLATLVTLVRDFNDKADQVLLVGHNPGLTELAEYLSGEMFGNIPTGGAVGLEFDVDSWSDLNRGAGKVLFADFPKDVRE